MNLTRQKPRSDQAMSEAAEVALCGLHLPNVTQEIFGAFFRIASKALATASADSVLHSSANVHHVSLLRHARAVHRFIDSFMYCAA